MSTLSVDTIQGLASADNVKLPEGCVVQTVNVDYNTETGFNSTSFVSSGLFVNITPKFSTSKILITMTAPLYVGVEGTWGIATIFKETGTAAGGSAISGTNLGHANYGFGYIHTDTSDQSVSFVAGNVTGIAKNLPATTSQVRYTVALRVNQSAANTMFCKHNAVASLVAQEIAQ